MSSAELAERVVPLTLGMISDPPTLILVYELQRRSEPGSRKRRKRTMPLRNFSDRSDVQKFIFMLQQRHSNFLAPVPQISLERILRIIQAVQRGSTIASAVKSVEDELGVNGEEDLNKISPEELQRKKELMSETFSKNLILPGDPGYVYDKEVEFQPSAGIRSAWDEDEDYTEQNSVDRTVMPETVKVHDDASAAPLEAEMSPASLRQNTALEISSRSTIDATLNKTIVEFGNPKLELTNQKSTSLIADASESTERKSDSILEDLQVGTKIEICEDAVSKSASAISKCGETGADSELESIGSEEIESEPNDGEPPISAKDLSKTYEFKLEDEEKENDENDDDDDFWKF